LITRLQPFADQADDALVADAVLHEPDKPIFAESKNAAKSTAKTKFTRLVEIPTTNASSASRFPRFRRNP
jgi:hypothetical protein